MAVTSVITCPECNKKFKGRDDLQGKKIRCPGCGHTFIVQTLAQDKVDSDEAEAPPAKAAAKTKSGGKAGAAKASTAPPPAAAAAPATAATPAAAKKPATQEFDEDGNPYDVTTLDLTPRCPNCTEPFDSADTLVCKYCGYNTQTRVWGKTKRLIEHTGGERFMWLLPGLLCLLGVLILYLGCVFLCSSVPDMVDPKSWTSDVFDSEAIRLWLTWMLLAIIWGLSMWAHKRLIFNPTPPEKAKE